MHWWPWGRGTTRDAEAGAKEAQGYISRLDGQGGEVKQLAELGRTQQLHNHFGEGIELAMKRRYA
ncbi:hypothetical protein PBI_GRETELLYN_39 [Gordonia phage GretelLyn]|uniref:Uncharacterized protein n=1 Tax=Gordonia phage GretelLyn TaxID=2599844 RepID=A0A5J6TCR8_9CAUD|nr:hypothetical protein PBI_GRETELLYN_39 [Gordonia phage GretelLyn]WNO26262.1 hypothetical protein SEA_GOATIFICATION_40 [Gordonia phage GOATification]